MSPEFQVYAERFVVATEKQAAALEQLATVVSRVGIKGLTEPTKKPGYIEGKPQRTGTER